MNPAAEPVLAVTPEPPYYAVIFASVRSSGDGGYAEMAGRMLSLARGRDGYLGSDSGRGPDGLGITVSYWRDLDAVKAWKADAEHREAQRLGREDWYTAFTVRIARVERAYAGP